MSQWDTVHDCFRSGKNIQPCTRSMYHLGAEEWLICSMYENARSRVRVGCNLSEEFSWKWVIIKALAWASRLFIMVLEALSQEFRIGCPWENLYSDDHHHWTVREADPLEDQHGRNGTSGLHGQNQSPDIWVMAPCASGKFGKDPHSMCFKGISTDSIFVVVVPVASTRNAVVSLALWSLSPASGVNGVLDSPDQ